MTTIKLFDDGTGTTATGTLILAISDSSRLKRFDLEDSNAKLPYLSNSDGQTVVIPTNWLIEYAGSTATVVEASVAESFIPLGDIS